MNKKAWVVTGAFLAALAFGTGANLLTPENLAAQQPQLPDVVVLEVAERFADTLPTRLAALLEWAQNTEA